MIRLVKATRFTQLQHKLLRRHSNFIQSMVCVFFYLFPNDLRFSDIPPEDT